MTYYIILTAFIVSIDSFVCGFSLALFNRKKLSIILIISLTVFTMCLVTNYATKLLTNYLTEKVSYLGGLLLIFIGIFNLVKSFNCESKKILEKNNFIQIFLIGFTVGIDGALANLSLSLMGLNQFYVPIVIASMHAFTVWLGILLSNTSIAKKFAKIEFLSPLILICLGAYKVLGLFI